MLRVHGGCLWSLSVVLLPPSTIQYRLSIKDVDVQNKGRKIGTVFSVFPPKVNLPRTPCPPPEPAKDCVSKMLMRDPKKRASAIQILQHDWMRENGVASDSPLQLEVLTRIKKFSAMNRLKKEALKVGVWKQLARPGGTNHQ